MKLKQGAGGDHLINMEFLFPQPPLPRFPPAIFDGLDLIWFMIDKHAGQLSGGFDGNRAVDDLRDGISPTMPGFFRGGNENAPDRELSAEVELLLFSDAVCLIRPSGTGQ